MLQTLQFIENEVACG